MCRQPWSNPGEGKQIPWEGVKTGQGRTRRKHCVVEGRKRGERASEKDDFLECWGGGKRVPAVA